ncbi:MAG: helix-turn-helix transcriptional regulator [Ruminococcus sp.]|nr:helix-turn-helix transcriptional regulator [Candidatus Copronaster equi]
MDFAKNFKEARIKAGLSQQKVADALGLDRSAIAHYEKGDATPNIKNIPEICELLNISFEELLK